MKDRIKYTIIIYPADEGGYVAEVPTLKGCLAQGETIQECLSELETVISLWIETARKNKFKIPTANSVLRKIKTISTNY